ncbi:MAG: hypothetical protein IID53_11965 [Proteobacteria bacterium]|nr:hypothetical protein [Pseudomonadota bacterium]
MTSDESTAASGWRRAVPYLLIFGLCLAVQAALTALKVPQVFDGELLGTDGYMRLVRVAGLHETGAWYDGWVARSNAPHGEVLHWTRPLDILLLAGAWVLTPVMGFREALFFAGAFVSPLLWVFTAVAFAWAGEPFFGRSGRYLAMIAFLVQPAVMDYSLAGRADHHMLLLLIFVVSFGLTARMLLTPFHAGLALAAGAVTGLGLWVGPEFLLALLAALAAMTLGWVLHGADGALKNRGFAIGLAVTVALALLAERPLAAILTEEHDRLSIVHFTLTLLALGFWSAARLIEGRGRRARGITGRLVIALIGAAMAGGSMYLLYPKFFAGPMVDIDPRVIPIWFDKIVESLPLLPTDARGAGLLLYYLGAALVCLPFLLTLLVRERSRPLWLAWLYVGLALAIYLPLAVFQVRLAIYPEILMALVIVTLVVRVRRRLDRDTLGGALARALATVGLLVGFSAAGLVLYQGIPAVAGVPAAPKGTGGAICRLKDMAAYLDRPGGFGRRRHTILATVDYGPELLYRTRHAVIATPYHRNPGIIDAHRILTAGTDRESRRLLEARGVDLILLCPSAPERTYFSNPGGARATLYRRLAAGPPSVRLREAGRAPAWLSRVALPAELAGGFRLYEVIRAP